MQDRVFKSFELPLRSSGEILFGDVVQEAAKHFGVSPSVVELRYLDSENEVISITSKPELEEALRIHKPSGILPLFVSFSQDRPRSVGPLRNAMSTEEQLDIVHRFIMERVRAAASRAATLMSTAASSSELDPDAADELARQAEKCLETISILKKEFKEGADAWRAEEASGAVEEVSGAVEEVSGAVEEASGPDEASRPDSGEAQQPSQPAVPPPSEDSTFSGENFGFSLIPVVEGAGAGPAADERPAEDGAAAEGASSPSPAAKNEQSAENENAAAVGDGEGNDGADNNEQNANVDNEELAASIGSWGRRVFHKLVDALDHIRSPNREREHIHEEAMAILVSMGFTDVDKNREVVSRFVGGTLDQVVCWSVRDLSAPGSDA